IVPRRRKSMASSANHRAPKNCVRPSPASVRCAERLESSPKEKCPLVLPGGHRSELLGNNYFFSAAPSRVAAQSRETGSPPLRPGASIFPVILSPSTLPLYLVTKALPLNSRFTLNEISSPLILPSEISVSRGAAAAPPPPWPPRPPIGCAMVPVILSPSALSFRVTLRGVALALAF